MHIFYKCSFKSSDGYKVAKYDGYSESLMYINEGIQYDRQEIPEVLQDTFLYSLGRSMLVATDENGQYFLGVYNLIEGNYDKYVNIIFTDVDSVKIMQLFSLLCRRYDECIKIMKNMVVRISPREDGLEFDIVKENVQWLLQEAMHEKIGARVKNQDRKLIAFVTEEESGYYLERLKENCKLDIKQSTIRENIMHNQSSVDIDMRRMQQESNLKVVLIIFIVIAFIVAIVVR